MFSPSSPLAAEVLQLAIAGQCTAPAFPKTGRGTRKVSVNLSNIDCLAYLATLADDSVDLALLDPPYEISRPTGFKNFKTGVARFGVSMDFGAWDHKGDPNFPEMRDVIAELYRVLRKGGTAIVFYDIWKVTHLADYFSDARFKQLRFLEWLKTNPVPINSKRNYLSNAREVAVLAVKGGKPTFNSEYDNGIYEAPICHEKGRFHPTQKPLGLIRTLVEKHSRKGDVVLDCFSGSGTTAVAAASCGRSFRGCELDPKFFELSLARLDASVPVGTVLNGHEVQRAL